MTAPSALLSIQDGNGAVENQGQGYVQQLSPGDTCTFALQSTSGFVPGLKWILQFESPDTPNLNGLEFVWDPRTLSAASFTFLLPPGGFTARYTTTAEDAQNILSQFTGEIFGNGHGITISPAAAKGQALVGVGDGTYTASGYRDYVNVLAFAGVDPTGASDSRAGFQSAINQACTNKQVLYIPYGTYQIYGVLYVPSALSIEGPGILTGAGIQPQLLQTLYQTPGGASQYFWGGTWMGPIFRCVPTTTSTPVGYVLGSGIYRVQFGGLAGASHFPRIPLGATPFSSLNGLTAFTMEWVVNYRENITLTNDIPYCGGCKTDHSTYTQAFDFHTINTGATFGATVAITTSGGSASVSTGGAALSINTDYAVRVTYDGAHLTLEMGTPGSTPSISVNTTATGTMVQNYWEDFVIGGSNGSGGCNYPISTGANTINKLEWGNFRLSNTAHATGGALRGTEFAAADVLSDTALLISFAPANRGDVIGDKAAVVATAYSPSSVNYIAAGPANIFLPIRDVFNIFSAFGPAVSFHRLAFVGFEALDIEVSIGVCTYDCYFQVRRGMTRYDNCYEWRDINPSFNLAPFNSGNAAYGWGAAYVANSGGGVLASANFGATQGSNFGLLFNLSGNSGVRDLFINLVGGPCGLFVNSSGDVVLDNCAMANEGSSTTQDCLAIFNRNTNVRWIGGGVFSETVVTSGCNILVDAGQTGATGYAQQSYLFNVDLAAGGGDITANFKSPSGGATVLPIMLDSAIQGQLLSAPFPWSDGSANLVVRPQEMNGVSTWNATGSGSITCMWGGNGLGTTTGPDFACRTIIITDSGSHLTGTTAVVAPIVFAGFRRRVVAPSTQSITFGAATGATVTIASGKSAEVESNGSGWVRVTPDT